MTKDALPLFETDMHHELLRYTATDITSAFSAGLIESVKSPKLMFKVRFASMLVITDAYGVADEQVAQAPLDYGLAVTSRSKCAGRSVGALFFNNAVPIYEGRQS